MPLGMNITKYSTPDDKIRLFLSLFRGRQDVYARPWQGKNGRLGYSPHCRFEWIRGTCGKPAVKCTECRRSGFFPYDAECADKHLRGERAAAIYPMMADGTCCLLTIRMSGNAWREDTQAVRSVCRNSRISCATEQTAESETRLWFFFESPLPAAAARSFGSALLTRAMRVRAMLPFSCYDELLPDRDYPYGSAFSGVVALPLWKAAREKGFSQFVDDDFDPYPDQWAHLASVQKIPKYLAESWPGAPHHPPLGMLYAQPDEGGRPWTHLKRTAEAADFPPVIKYALSDRLTLSTIGLTCGVQDQIQRLAAFENPFYDKNCAAPGPLRQPERVICRADNANGQIALPRGCTDAFLQLVSLYRSVAVLHDERTYGKPAPFQFTGQLREDQEQALEAMLAHDGGVLSAATAFGKTVLAAALIARRGVNTLILVHRKQLLEQWRARLTDFLRFINTPEGARQQDRPTIGSFGSGKDLRSGLIDIAMFQSMPVGEGIPSFIGEYGMVIVDECHHVPAQSFERVMKQVRGRYVYGLTATPARQDGLQPLLYMQLGPVRHIVDAREQAEKRPFRHVLLPCFTGARYPMDSRHAQPALTRVYAQIVTDEKRNGLIIKDVMDCLGEGRNCLLLSERTEHVRRLAASLTSLGVAAYILMGGASAAESKRRLDSLSHARTEVPLAVCATGKYIGEGFDEARLDTLFLTMPISWQGTLAQYIGRLHRLYDNKREVRVYDYIDGDVHMLDRMFLKRLQGYAANGYGIRAKGEPADAPPGVLYDKNSYHERFYQDLGQSAKSVVLTGPYLSVRCAEQLAGTLKVLTDKKVRVAIITRPPAAYTGRAAAGVITAMRIMRAIGVRVETHTDVFQKRTLIDDGILWYGSLSPLYSGSGPEYTMRLECASFNK